MAKFPMTVRAVADLLGAAVEGDDSVVVESLAALDAAGPGELTFATDERRAARLAQSQAGAAIVSTQPPSAAVPLIRVENVAAAVAGLLGHLAEPEDLPPPGRHESALVAADADLAEDAAVGPNVVIRRGVKVGRGSALCANVFLGAGAQVGCACVLAEGVVVRAGVRIGDRVRVGPNSVIGYDGFGYYTEGGVHHRFSHTGNVVIEDDVELGACVCVDRAKFGSTRIGAGTKIDNLVQVAHNVQIGRGCLLAGQCGVAGSARLGNYVALGGNAGVRDNVTLGDGVQCSAFAAVASNVPDGQAVMGIPARPAREALRALQVAPKLPDLIKRVKALEARLSALESAKDH